MAKKKIINTTKVELDAPNVDTTANLNVGADLDVTGSITVDTDVTITGDLTVNGTEVIVNTTDLNVTDNNILINNDGNDASAEGAGITIERTGTDGSIVYEDALASKFKVGSVGSEVEVVNVSSSQTLTNKTLDADNNTISNLAHGAEVDNPSSGVHGVTGSVVGTTDAQTLSSKTLSNPIIDSNLELIQTTTPSTPASGRNKIYSKGDDKLYILDSGGIETEIGSGAGGTAENELVNYFDFPLAGPNNPGAETDASGFVAYSDGGATPTDGDGGSPVITAPTRITTNQLRGDGSFQFDKDAADRQGEGWSISGSEFILENADSVKWMTVTFDYETSGSYVDGDVGIYMYDTSGAVMTKVGDLPAKGTGGVFFFPFQTSIFDSYRFVMHIQTTNASSWSIKTDAMRFGPSVQPVHKFQRKILGSNITTDTTFLSFNNLDVGKVYRVGGSVRLKVNQGGSDSAVELRVADGSTTLARYNWTNTTTGTNTNQGLNIIYKATDPTLNFISVSASAVSRIEGDGTTDQTWFTLEELPFAAEVSDWT